MKLVQILSVLLFSTASFASPIDVGGGSIELPAPRGFALVVPEMTEVGQLVRLFIIPQASLLAAFIAESDVPQALANEIPPLNRYFIVTVSKDLVNITVTAPEFLTIKQYVKSEAEQNAASIKKEVREHVSKASRGFAEQLGRDVEMNVGDVIHLAPHHEDRLSISSSLVAKTMFIDESGEQHSRIFSGTVAVLHVQERVLFVNAYGGKEDLGWTREIVKEWVKAIVDANAKRSLNDTAEVLRMINRRPDRSAEATGRRIGIAIAGLIIGIVAWLVNRRKTN